MVKVKVRLVRSPIGQTKKLKENLKGLGLSKIGQERVFHTDPRILGMIKKVSHLVELQEI